MGSWTFGKHLSHSPLRRLAPALLVFACAAAGVQAAARPELLPAGSKAPDFTADADGGGQVQLSGQKGKVVVLDFWATWCGPCQRSLPHLESVAKKVAGQNVSILGLCVWDSREKYEAWLKERRKDFTFKFAYDPAGQSPSNIAAGLYRVNGIPTTYIIDKDGKVAETIVGYTDGDNRIEKALAKLGIKVS